MTGDLLVFGGSAHRQLAADIAGALGVRLGAADTIRFSNENLKVKVQENVRGRDVFVIQPSCPPVSDGIVELLVFTDALRSASAGRITVVTPYFPYARSDKKDEPRISITARLMADLLVSAGADRVLTMDLHSPQIQGFFRVPSDHLTAVPLLARQFQGRAGDWVVVAADAGEAKDADRWARRLKLPLAVAEKRRFDDREEPEIVGIVGEVAGRHALIVDDEISTGRTMQRVIEFMFDRLPPGARPLDVCAAAVHPVFARGLPAFVERPEFHQLVVTDSVPIAPAAAGHAKLAVVSVAELLAEAIRRIHAEESVSGIFEGR